MKNPGMYPFLFYVPEKDDQSVLTDHLVADKAYWVVKLAQFDYTSYASKWMCDDQLGDYCLVPDVDITETSVRFDSESEALEFIGNWWKKQLS